MAISLFPMYRINLPRLGSATHAFAAVFLSRLFEVWLMVICEWLGVCNITTSKNEK